MIEDEIVENERQQPGVLLQARRQSLGGGLTDGPVGIVEFGSSSAAS